MKRPAVLVPVIIVVNACLWGLAMVLSAVALKGTGLYQEIQHVLGGCAAGSLLVVAGGMSGLARRLKEADAAADR